MNLKRIELINFTSHEHSILELPDKGILAIIGENGAGKSSFCEGIAWACWNKTMRGTPPWHGSGETQTQICTAALVTDWLRIKRTREGKKSTLEWEAPEGVQNGFPGSSSDDPLYDTPTKASAALAQMIGPFDVWRRSHVFSSSDAAHFTLATDGERKRLIEAFLQLDRFDPALKRCREDLKAAQARVIDLAHKRALNATKLDSLRERLRDVKQTLAAQAPEPPEPPPAPGIPKPTGKPLAEYDQLLGSARRETTALRAKQREIDAEGGKYDAELEAAKKLLTRLHGETCPTCTQPIPDKLKKKAQLAASLAETHAREAKDEAKSRRVELDEAIDELEDEIRALQEKRNARALEVERERAQAREAERLEQERAAWKKQRELMEKQLRSIDGEITVTADVLGGLAPLHEEAEQDAKELEVIEQVLGLKGVRATILGRSLSGIEAVANAWLARLPRDDGKIARVRLSPYSENKNGTIEESISVDVHGMGDDKGYKAMSSGERRRLDVAMLLALAEVSSAAQGTTPGTLFFDEVLDSLDGVGVDSVAAALQELAHERCVVVITHSSALVGKLAGATKLRVVQGKLEAV